MVTPRRKLPNPKDALGSNKVPMHLWPQTATVWGAMGMLDGATKYGRSNWRATGVRASIYNDAIIRHLSAWFEGEDIDPDSGLPHMAHLLASAAIIVDAIAAGKFRDDRMASGGYRVLLDEATPHVNRLKEKNALHTPHHFTIEDGDLRQFDEPEKAEGPGDEDDGRRLAEEVALVGSAPEVVVLCGSSRFIDQMAVQAWELEKQGALCLSLHLLPASYTSLQSHQAEAEGVAAQLDEIHLRKIDLADRVLVMNVGGYIGESTRVEIEYATRIGKPISYLEPAIKLNVSSQD